MTITTGITLKQYIRLMFMMAYRKPVLILLVVFDLLMITWVVSYYMDWFSWLPEPEYPQYLTILLITFVQPFVIYLTIKKNYKTSTTLNNEVKLTFTETKLIMSSKLFYAEYLWHKAYKLVELNNWFLIYQNTLAAILIDKSDLTPGQEEEFKALVGAIPDLEVKLKNRKN